MRYYMHVINMIAKLMINFAIQKIVAIKFCNANFTMMSLFRLDGNFAEGFKKGGRYFVCVTHGGADVLVAHGLLYGVRVAVGSELQGTVSMAEAMECYVLCDA